MKQFLVTLMIVFSLLSNASAKKNKHLPVTFTLEVADSSLYGKDISIEKYPYYTITIQSRFCKTVSQKLSPNPSQVVLQTDQKCEYIRISIPQPNLFYNNKIFLIRAGDKVKLKFDDGKIYFSGKDAARYNCQVEYSSATIPFVNGLNMTPISFFAAMLKREVALSLKQDSIISTYEHLIGTEISKIMKFNARYKAYSNNLITLFGAYEDTRDSLTKVRLYDLFKSFTDTLSNSNMNIELALNSSTYVYFLYLKERCAAEFPDGIHNPNGDLGFSTLHQNVLSKYSGPLRDRILTTIAFTTTFQGRINQLEMLRKDFPKITDPYSKELMIKQYTAYGKGQEAFNFHLPDVNDQIVSMEDFKGRVVILDFYFNGCTGCAILNKDMKPIYEEFSSNPKVAFVSVSVDKTKDIFHKGVNSGIYTHKEGINLYTNGKGEDHEIIKHYGIEAFPKLIIIGMDGRLIDSDPPFPSDGEMIDKFKKIINNAVADQ